MGGLHNWRSYQRRVAFQGMIEHPALSIFFLMSASWTGVKVLSAASCLIMPHSCDVSG